MNSPAHAELPAQAGEAAPMAEVPATAPESAPASVTGVPRWLLMCLALVSLLALLASAMLWQKLSSIQEQLARQSADAGAQSVEARAVAK